MSCSEWETRIALHIEGDAVDDAVDRHLSECVACRQFAAGLRDSKAALKDLAGEALDPAALVAVRAQVLGELERPKKWTWGFAAAAAVLLLLLTVVLVRVRRPVAPLPQPAVARAPRMIEPQPAPRPRAVRHVPKRRPQPERPKLAAASRTEPLVIKFVTDDPNIVVIWLVEGKGETE